jgi:hypothetical protein
MGKSERRQAMKKTIWQWMRECGGEFCSARYFLTRAVMLGIFFIAAHLAGLREYTTFLAGTAANPELGIRWSSFLGMMYLAAYLGVVVVAPILILAAGLLAIGGRGRKLQSPQVDGLVRKEK